MSRIAASDHLPVGPTPRRFTPKQKRDAFVTQHGWCPGCSQRFAEQDMEMDHIIPLALGGAEHWSNHELRCKPCHAAKTKRDIKSIAKAKRLAGETCSQPTKRPLRSRGFDKTKTRHMDGSVTTRPV